MNKQCTLFQSRAATLAPDRYHLRIHDQHQQPAITFSIDAWHKCSTLLKETFSFQQRYKNNFNPIIHACILDAFESKLANGWHDNSYIVTSCCVPQYMMKPCSFHVIQMPTSCNVTHSEKVIFPLIPSALPIPILTEKRTCPFWHWSSIFWRSPMAMMTPRSSHVDQLPTSWKCYSLGKVNLDAIDLAHTNTYRNISSGTEVIACVNVWYPEHQTPCWIFLHVPC